jgi:hypothetical protein
MNAWKILKTVALGTLALLEVVIGLAYAQPIFSNNLFLLGGNAGVTPQIQALGTDTNISINLVPKGTGTVQVNGTAIPGVSGGAGTFTSITVSGTSTFNGPQVTQIGTSGVTHNDGGISLFVQTTDTGNGADVTEDTLATFTLPANSLITNGNQRIEYEGYLSNAANADTKRLRVYFGATVICDSTAQAFNGAPLYFRAVVYLLTNTTQKAQCVGVQPGSVGGAWNAAAGGGMNATTPAETTTGAVVLKVTGTAGVANANDIVLKVLSLTYYPQP